MGHIFSILAHHDRTGQQIWEKTAFLRATTEEQKGIFEPANVEIRKMLDENLLKTFLVSQVFLNACKRLAEEEGEAAVMYLIPSAVTAQCPRAPNGGYKLVRAPRMCLQINASKRRYAMSRLIWTVRSVMHGPELSQLWLSCVSSHRARGACRRETSYRRL